MKPPTPIKTAALAALAAGLALPAAHAQPTSPVGHAPAPAVVLSHTFPQPALTTEQDYAVSLDCHSQGLRDVLLQLFKDNHKDYVIDPSIPNASVTLHLSNVSMSQALEGLVNASSQEFQWNVQGGAYHIEPQSVISAVGAQEPRLLSNPSVTLDLKKVPIRQALDDLFTAAKANYTVAAGVPDDNDTVTVHLTNVPLVLALDAVLAASNTPLTFTVKEGIFAVAPKRVNPLDIFAPTRSGGMANPFTPSVLPHMGFVKPVPVKVP